MPPPRMPPTLGSWLSCFLNASRSRAPVNPFFPAVLLLGPELGPSPTRPAVPSALRFPCFRGGVGTPPSSLRPLSALCLSCSTPSLPHPLLPRQPLPTSHLLPKPGWQGCDLGVFPPPRAPKSGLEGRKGTKGCAGLRPVSLVCALVLGSGGRRRRHLAGSAQAQGQVGGCRGATAPHTGAGQGTKGRRTRRPPGSPPRPRALRRVCLTLRRP